MRVIPVVDLLGGAVVHGMAGRRDEYRPIESRLCPTAQPRAVAQSIQRHFGFREAYLADLDAIAGGEPAWGVYRELLDDGWRLWIDAGLGTLDRAERLAGFQHGGRKVDGVIVGLESLAVPEMLAELLGTIGSGRLVFSLDLKQGRPLTSIAAWYGHAPLEIARHAVACGVRRFIVLDLAAVGMSAGVGTLSLCRDLRRLTAELEIVTGGGVRGPADLQAVAEAGCDGALVASALHDGRLTPGDLTALI